MIHRKAFTLNLIAVMLLVLAAGAFAQDEPATSPHYRNYDSALAAGTEKGREILIDFYTDW
jgi:hypothetical protein